MSMHPFEALRRSAAPVPSPSGPQVDDRGGWEPPPTPFPVVVYLVFAYRPGKCPHLRAVCATSRRAIQEVRDAEAVDPGIYFDWERWTVIAEAGD